MCQIDDRLYMVKLCVSESSSRVGSDRRFDQPKNSRMCRTPSPIENYSSRARKTAKNSNNRTDKARLNPSFTQKNLNKPQKRKPKLINLGWAQYSAPEKFVTFVGKKSSFGPWVDIWQVETPMQLFGSQPLFVEKEVYSSYIDIYFWPIIWWPTKWEHELVTRHFTANFPLKCQD